MNNVDLYLLLDDIYRSNFLEAIEIIIEKTPEYKKSDFFKKTKLPLEVLYEKYFHFLTVNYSFEEKLEQFIEGIDSERLADTIVKVVQNLENNQDFMGKVEKFIETFNIEQIQKQNEEFDKIIKTFK